VKSGTEKQILREEAVDVRLRIFLDTNREEKNIAGELKGKLGTGFLRFAAVLITLMTLWVVVGSLVYPLWWFEFIFKRGFLNWSMFVYGFDYLLKNVAWLLFAFPVAILVTWVIARKWLPNLTSFLNRFGVYVIVCCTVVCLIDAYELNRTQRFTYERTFGVLKIADALAQAVGALAGLGLPPSRVVPPMDFIYVDTARVAMLHSELGPPLVEKERTVTTESKSDESVGLERKPLELKAGGSTGRTEAQKFESVDPSTSRECLDVINNLLARQSPPYYSTFDQLSNFQILNQAKELMKSLHASLPPQSLFTGAPPDTGGAAILRQMTEIRQKTPPAEIEKGIRTQLGQVSGLVLVQGDFTPTSHRPGSGQFEEQFKSGPYPIAFRFALRDKEALSLLTDHSRLFVLGNVIKNWDGGPYIDLHPIAILSGAVSAP
jgi:hypothetical protein